MSQNFTGKFIKNMFLKEEKIRFSQSSEIALEFTKNRLKEDCVKGLINGGPMIDPN